MGLSIVGSMMSFSAAQQQADAQNQYYLDNAREAQRAATDQYMYQNVRFQQEKEAAQQQAFEVAQEGLKKRASAYTSAGEAGVSGLSVDALVGDLFAQTGRRQMSVDTQFQMTRENIVAEGRQSQAQAQSRINSVQRVHGPSPMAYLIKGITGGLSGLGGKSGLQIA